jgi:microcin C transport system substrate-binding protein
MRVIKGFFYIFAVFLFISNSFASSGVDKNEFKHGISVFGDLKYQKNFKNFSYVNPNAPKGGEIKYGSEGTFNNLNPFILKGISAQGMGMIFDSLMESSADEISSKYGLIAKEAKIANDNKSVIFNLRKYAKFHDDSKITADDVIFSFNVLTNEGHPSYKMIYRDVLNVKKLNTHQVQFNFKNDNNRELPLTIASLPILSKKFYEGNKFNKTTLSSPLGSGPYEVENIDAGKSISFKRVKNYWAKDLPINVGRYNFDKITYDYYRDGNVLVEAFKSGEYDFRQENIARNWANAYNIDKVWNGNIIKREIKHNLPASMQAFVFNLRKKKFQNRHLREAITLAFDFPWVREKIFYGSYIRTNSYFANSKFASSNLPSRKELRILNKFKNQIPKEVFEKEFKLPTQKNSNGYNRESLLKAKNILKKTGFVVKDNKLIDPKTKLAVDIEFLIGSKSFQMVVAPMIKNLERLGIYATIRLVEQNQYQTRLKNYDYDISINVFGNKMIPGNEHFSYWHSSQKDVIGGNNMAGVDNKVIDYLVTKISNAKNEENLKTLTKSLDRVLLWNFYTIPQWHNDSYRILYYNKFSMPKNNPPYSLNLDAWWSKKIK